jgi:hypothetical protein
MESEETIADYRRVTDWAIWRTVDGGASPSTVTR